MITLLHNLILEVWSLAHSPLFLFLAAIATILGITFAILDFASKHAPMDTDLWPPNPNDPDYDLWNE